MSSGFIISDTVMYIFINMADNEGKFGINPCISRINHNNMYLYKGSLEDY